MTDLHVAMIASWDRRGGIANYAERLVTELRDLGLEVTPVPIPESDPANPLAFTDLVDAVPADADVIHVQFEAGLFGRLGMSGVGAPAFFVALGRTDVPVVTTLHEVHRRHDHRGTAGDLLLRGRDLVIERLALRASARTIVHTREARRVLEDRHGDGYRIDRLLHPADVDATLPDGTAPKDELGIDGHAVLTFGWVEPKKRYRDVIDVLPDLPDVTYLIAGGERDRHSGLVDELLAYADERGVGDRVDYLGYVEEDDVPIVFGAADVVVLPYDRVSQSGVVNDALAYRRPVVASSLPAFEELREEFDCLVTYETEEELRERIATVLSDEALRERLKTKAGAYTDEISWPAFARRTADLYASIVGSDP